MTEQLRAWILGAAGAAIFCAIASELTPDGRVKGVQRLLCGVVMTLVLLTPIVKLDFGAYSVGLAKYTAESEKILSSSLEISDSLSRTIIEEKCEAYILDKAKSLGAELLGADVEVRWSGEGVWYPVSVKLNGGYDSRLSERIEAELGIGAKAQEWSGT